MANIQSAQQTEPETAFLEGYGRMLLIRQFETSMHRLFLQGEVHGTTHLYAGQEAVAVGCCLALEPDDYVTGTYRGHGHALAKGTDPRALLAEMLGRATGVCGGRSGSMNVIDLRARARRLLRHRRRLDRRGDRRRSVGAVPGQGRRWPSSATVPPTRATSTSA